MAAPQDALRRLERRGAFVARRRLDSFWLPAAGPSVAEARRRVRVRVSEWGVADEVRADAEMVVSELFTNAVRHTTSDRVTCELILTGGDRLRIEVTDRGRSATEPQQRAADVDEEGGRGLLLVSALTDTWGVRPAGTGDGSTVWAELSRDRSPAGPL